MAKTSRYNWQITLITALAFLVLGIWSYNLAFGRILAGNNPELPLNKGWNIVSLPCQDCALKQNLEASASKPIIYAENKWQAVSFDDLKPGQGAIISVARNLKVPISDQIEAAVKEIDLPNAGWHLVGNPLGESFEIGQVLINNSAGQSVRLATASEQKLIEGIYLLDSALGQYQITPLINWQLKTGQGFWIKTNQNNLKLIFGNEVTN